MVHLRCDAFHEGKGIESQIEAYCARYGVYPEVILGGWIYGTRDNRRYLKGRGSRFSVKPSKRPKNVMEVNQEALKREQGMQRKGYLQRIPIGGKYGHMHSA